VRAPFADLLRRQGFVLLDGGLATELEARGHDLRDPLWSARLLRDAPAEIRAVHESYVAAGADCLITASYQATPGALGPRHLLLSVALAREAGPKLVAASVGPYGAALADGSEYTGDYGDVDLARWHRDRFEALDGSDADLLACETIPSFPEARALAGLLSRKAAWFSFSCRDGKRIADGTPIRECARFLDGFDLVCAIGVNCTAPRHVESLVGEVRAATGKPVVAYPNSGERWDAATRGWTGARDPSGFADAAVRWLRAGAALLGGCCRTGPDHVRRMRERLLEACAGRGGGQPASPSGASGPPKTR
jgi:homocysteine S-methyltransferase